jgi:hypothetical protein
MEVMRSVFMTTTLWVGDRNPRLISAAGGLAHEPGQ